jgi:hypothetical protein
MQAMFVKQKPRDQKPAQYKEKINPYPVERLPPAQNGREHRRHAALDVKHMAAQHQKHRDRPQHIEDSQAPRPSVLSRRAPVSIYQDHVPASKANTGERTG